MMRIMDGWRDVGLVAMVVSYGLNHPGTRKEIGMFWRIYIIGLARYLCLLIFVYMNSTFIVAKLQSTDNQNWQFYFLLMYLHLCYWHLKHSRHRLKHVGFKSTNVYIENLIYLILYIPYQWVIVSIACHTCMEMVVVKRRPNQRDMYITNNL